MNIGSANLPNQGPEMHYQNMPWDKTALTSTVQAGTSTTSATYLMVMEEERHNHVEHCRGTDSVPRAFLPLLPRRPGPRRSLRIINKFNVDLYILSSLTLDESRNDKQNQSVLPSIIQSKVFRICQGRWTKYRSCAGKVQLPMV